MSGLTIGKQSIIEITNNYRHDIIINGFNTTYIALKNDLIRLFHSIKGMTVDSSITPSISFNGHGHNFEIPSNCNVPLTVRVPSISNICTSKETLPTGIDMECNFENEYIKDIEKLINKIPNYCPIKVAIITLMMKIEKRINILRLKESIVTNIKPLTRLVVFVCLCQLMISRIISLAIIRPIADGTKDMDPGTLLF